MWYTVPQSGYTIKIRVHHTVSSSCIDAVMCLSLSPADLVGPEVNSTWPKMLNLLDGSFIDFMKNMIPARS